jgi:protein TonB
VKPPCLTLIGVAALVGAGACAAEGLAIKPLDAPKVDDTPPQMLRNSCARPEYPWLSIQNKEAGVTTVRLRVDNQGKVIRSSVEKSSGFARLDAAARESLALCRFEPSRDSKGAAVYGTALIDYPWRLEDAPRDPWTQLRALHGAGRDATVDFANVPFSAVSQANAEQRIKILRGVQEAATKNAGCASIEAVTAPPPSAEPKAAAPSEGDDGLGSRIVREFWGVQQCGYTMQYALLMFFPERGVPGYEMTPLIPGK